MKRPTLTPGERIARRIFTNFYGQPWNREERIAAAIDRAIKAAQRDMRFVLTGAKNNPYRRPRK